MQRKGAWQIIHDTLSGFPAALSASDRDFRDTLLELLAEQPRDEVRWLSFLRNERELAEKTGHTEILAGRCKAMGAMLPAEVAEVVVAEVMLPDPGERREAFAVMARRGAASSRLFLAWAELERGQKSLERAREAIEAGLRAGAPASPGRPQLEKELDRAKDDLMMQQERLRQAAAAATVAASEGGAATAKKGRAGLQQRRRLNSIGGPARVKPGAQEPLVEPESDPTPSPAPPIAVVFVAPPESLLSMGDQDSDNSSRRKHVTFAASSPAPAPAGPRPAAPRPGSMSPAPLPSSFTAARNARPLSTAGSDASPKRWAELSFSQTPMAVRGKEAVAAVAARPEQRDEGGASRVLFPSPVKPPTAAARPQADSAAAAVPVVVVPSAAFVENAAALPKPAVVPPPLARVQQQQQKAKSEAAAAASEEDAFKRVAGDMVEVGKRRLEVLQSLGKGGYSRVFKVLDRATFECFAMKEVLPPKEKDDRSFSNEVAILTRLKAARLDKEYVVALAEAHERPDRSVMLLEAGEADLYRLLDRSKRARAGRILPVTPMTEIKHYWHLLLRCVAKLHASGIVHCDLKPQNFVLFSGRLKVVDFGIAVQLGSGERQTKGTLHYLPPELLQTVLDGSNASEPAAFSRDVWALGCMLYEMGYGRTPFVSEKDEKRVQILMRQIANPNSVVSYSDQPAMAVLNACVRACLRHNPAERPTVTDLLKHTFLTAL